MKNVMLDLETLSTRSNAMIVTIGAIKFSDNVIYPETIDKNEIVKLDTFYRRIDLNSYKNDINVHIDDKTIEWWKTLDYPIQFESLYHPDRVSIKQALDEFREWFSNDPYIKIYGNGSSFDCSILGEMYNQHDMETPWKFWNIRDLRTVMDIGNIKMNTLPQTNLHDAICDCYRQIIGYQRSMKAINSKRC